MTDTGNSLMLASLKDIRTDLREHRTLLLQLVDAERRQDKRFATLESRFGHLESRINDLTPELELMLKGEIMGRLAHFETQIDNRLAQLAARIDAKPIAQ